MIEFHTLLVLLIIGISQSTGQGDCGRANPPIHFLSIGSEPASPNQYPWMVQLSNRGSLCGGSLISKRHVLTAYHCIEGAVADDITVLVGGHWSLQHLGRLNSKFIDGEKFRVARTVYPRPDANNATGYVWNKCYSQECWEKHNCSTSQTECFKTKAKFPMMHDIAIIILEQPVKFSDTVRTVCLPSSKNFVWKGQTCTAMGWGVPHHEESLMHLTLKVDDDNNKSGNINYFTTGESKNSKGEHKNVCFGDSGGPLVHQDPQTEKWTIIGTANSVQFKNCQGGAGWNKVTAHLDWITDVLDGDKAKVCCSW